MRTARSTSTGSASLRHSSSTTALRGSASAAPRAGRRHCATRSSPRSSPPPSRVSVTAHLWGPQIAEMIRRHSDGDVDGSRALHEQQQPSYDLLRIQINPIPIKAALNLTGHEVGGHRLPMVEADEEELLQVRACL